MPHAVGRRRARLKAHPMRRTRLSPWLLAAVAAAPLPARTQPTPGLPPASASQEVRPPADGSPVFPDRRTAGVVEQATLPALQFGNFRVLAAHVLR